MPRLPLLAPVGGLERELHGMSNMTADSFWEGTLAVSDGNSHTKPHLVFDNSPPSSIDRAVLSRHGAIEHLRQRYSTTIRRQAPVSAMMRLPIVVQYHPILDSTTGWCQAEPGAMFDDLSQGALVWMPPCGSCRAPSTAEVFWHSAIEHPLWGAFATLRRRAWPEMVLYGEEKPSPSLPPAR